ncbi:hypothetical protein JB92DRAFT_2831594 [Gautieria morchelliformis]|nr:hypothetical protein JB92DRAFT_2831594 [Gautieria morchelliformis]
MDGCILGSGFRGGSADRWVVYAFMGQRDVVVDHVDYSLETHPSTPPSSNEPPLALKARKMREEFTTCDLDHLLAAMLAVNPDMVPHMKIGEKWREVATLVQEKGFCQNQEADTLKNLEEQGVLYAYMGRGTECVTYRRGINGHGKAKRTRSSRADDSGKENEVDEDNKPGVSSTESNKRT